jgi:4-oxalocrotonate tautomerase
MPLIEVKLYDRRVNPEAAERIITELTEGLCRAVGEEVRDLTWVVVQGVPANCWGIAGKAGA